MFYRAHVYCLSMFCLFSTAIRIDGCNVVGYSVWSLLDNLEWSAGYLPRFGLHFVNFTDPDRPRLAKMSAHFYGMIVRMNGFVMPDGSRLGNGVTSASPPQRHFIGQFINSLIALFIVLYCVQFLFFAHYRPI